MQPDYLYTYVAIHEQYITKYNKYSSYIYKLYLGPGIIPICYHYIGFAIVLYTELLQYACTRVLEYTYQYILDGTGYRSDFVIGALACLPYVHDKRRSDVITLRRSEELLSTCLLTVQ